MKCDELKQVENPIEWGLYYDKNEVDAAIDQLKRYHHRERHEYIAMVAQHKAKLVEQESENRRLKRALWLARAERARDNSILLPSKFMRNVWDNVERKCLKKSKEYL